MNKECPIGAVVETENILLEMYYEQGVFYRRYTKNKESPIGDVLRTGNLLPEMYYEQRVSYRNVS